MINQDYEFKHPITYTKNKSELENELIKDLELLEFSSKENKEKGLVEFILQPESVLGHNTLHFWTNNITTNKDYLTDTQLLIKKLPSFKRNLKNHAEVVNTWDQLQKDDNFLNKYRYIEYKHFKYLNNNIPFLQLLSIYNIASPIAFLIIPIIMFIIPFFILKFKKLEISFSTYFSLLKKVLKNHALGAILNTNFKSIEMGGLIYLLITIGIYLFQVYQQVVTCINFHKNMKKVHENFLCVGNFLKETNQTINILIPFIKNKKSYGEFYNQLIIFNKELEDYIKDIDFITPYCISIKTFSQMGVVMKHFYNLYTNSKINQFMNYSFLFNGYVDNLIGWNKLIKDKKINSCVFDKNTSFNEGYYPKLMNNDYVGNSYNLKKNIIITGPNAAGKTTLIKGTILNIIFSQQIGFGFYKKASINPYDHVHCYLNIPDTSGRDSLFQAEARRCKNILDNFKLYNKERHFCIFDELYSGTNPYEAVASAYGFLNFISENKNINFMITTHYYQLCNLLKTNINIINKNMKIIKKEKLLEYTYKMEYGISNIKGAFTILKDLNYDEKILKDIEVISKKIL
jgi:hypothetical protein